MPSNIARKVVGDLKEFGTVQRAMMGISMWRDELTPAVAKELGTDEVSGIYVYDVIPNGAAAKAGIKKGDVIKRINGIEIKTRPEFQGQLAKYHPGATISVTVSRGGKLKDLDVVLQNTYGDVALVDKNYTGILGATVEPLSREGPLSLSLERGSENYRYKEWPL